METISILGCGWYGLPVGKALASARYKVQGSTTSANRFDELQAAGIQPYLVDIGGDTAEHDAAFFNCATLLISMPPKLRGGGHDEYLNKIAHLATLIKKHGVKQVIFISSTGVYPEANMTFTEGTPFDPDTASGKTLLAAENLLREETAFTTTIIRFGGLVGPGRHPGRFFAGKTDIPNGQAPVNLIHLYDCIGITEAVLKQNAWGHTINASSPHHLQKQHFYTEAAKNAGLPLPHFIDELNDWKIINSTNLSQVLNYSFVVANWNEAFDNDLFKTL